MMYPQTVPITSQTAWKSKVLGGTLEAEGRGLSWGSSWTWATAYGLLGAGQLC